MGNFGVPSTRPVQPRFVRPICSVGNSFGREQFGLPGIRGGPRFAGPLRGEMKRTEINMIPTSGYDGQSLRDFTQRSLVNDSNFHPSQIRSRDSVSKTEQKIDTKNLMSKGPEYALNNQAGLPERKESFYTNNRELPQRTTSTPEVTSSQFINSEYIVSSLIKREHFKHKRF